LISGIRPACTVIAAIPITKVNSIDADVESVGAAAVPA